MKFSGYMHSNVFKKIFVNKAYCLYRSDFQFLDYYPIFMSKFDCYQKLFKKCFWSKKSIFFFYYFFDALVTEATSGGNIAPKLLDA